MRRISVRVGRLPVFTTVLVVTSLPALDTEAQGQSLSGSAASLDRQNAQAAAHGFTYLESPGHIRRFVDGGYLVPIVPNGDFELHQVSFPYARAEVRVFVERLARQYRSACGETLVVTSLTRPLSEQPRNASDRSVHPTGMAIDLRRSNRTACRRWLESTLLALESRGVLEATRERRPPHYHLAIYPRLYGTYVAALTGNPDLFASGGSEPSMEMQWIEHSVRRGETLGSIASRYDVTVSRIRSENGIRGDRLLVGQRLQVPVYRIAEAPVEDDPAERAEPIEAVAVGAEVPSDASEVAGFDIETTTEQADPPEVVHTVSRGESLWTIARQYGVDEATLRRANRISGDRIFSGQTLVVPSGPVDAPTRPLTHRVSRGESLWTIARAYGVDENAIRALNGIRGSRILVGEEFTIPAGSGQAVLHHTVEEGESLWIIANRHGTTVEALRRTNGIRTSRIYAGQTLNVPFSF